MPPKTSTIRGRNRDTSEIIAFAYSLLHLLGTQILPLLFIILFEACRWVWNHITRAQNHNIADNDDITEANHVDNKQQTTPDSPLIKMQTPKINFTKTTSSPFIVSAHQQSPSTQESGNRRSNHRVEMETTSESIHEQMQLPYIRLHNTSSPNIGLQNTSSSLSSPSPAPASGSSSPNKSEKDSNTKRLNRQMLPPSLSTVKRFIAQQKKSKNNSPRLTNEEAARKSPRVDNFMDAFRKHFLLGSSFKSSYQQ